MVSQVGHAAELLKSELSSARLCTSQTPLNSLSTHAVRHARQKGIEATDRDVHEAGLSAFGERVDIRTHRALREAGQLRRHHTKPAVRAAWAAAQRPATMRCLSQQPYPLRDDGGRQQKTTPQGSQLQGSGDGGRAHLGAPHDVQHDALRSHDEHGRSVVVCR